MHGQKNIKLECVSVRDALRKDRQYLYLIGVPNVRLMSSASASGNPNKEVNKSGFY